MGTCGVRNKNGDDVKCSLSMRVNEYMDWHTLHSFPECLTYQGVFHDLDVLVNNSHTPKIQLRFSVINANPITACTFSLQKMKLII